MGSESHEVYGSIMAGENQETARLRQIVREEIARSSDTNTRNPVTLSTQSVYERTQQLIRGAASTAVNELTQNQPRPFPTSTTVPSVQVSPTHNSPGTVALSLQRSRGSVGKRKSQPGHPWRLKAASASKRKAVEGKSIYVWLLDFPVDNYGNDYVLDDSMVILKGFVTLNPNDNPREIKQKITSLFQTKFPHFESYHFDFVKRERNKVCTPATEASFSWNFSALKNLWGQGKLYCRLNVSQEIIEEDHNSNNDVDIESYSYPSDSASGDQPSTSATQSSTSVTRPSASATQSSTSGSQPSTRCTQPSTSSTQLLTSGTQILNDETRVSELQNLVHELLDKQEKPITFNTLNEALTHFNSRLYDRERLRVEQSYVLEEALAYYKSVEFQPHAKLIIQYKGQSAVDTGGVMRQFFTDVFSQMMEGGGDLPPLFEGFIFRKLPVYNAGTVLSGVLELVGKIFAHSIVQAGIGPCCLSPAVYRFLATGELNEAIALLTIDDVVNPVLKNYVKLVYDTENEGLNDIFSEDDFQQMLVESGITQMLTANTRESIMQSLIYHDAIGKRVVALEQIRKGMKLLGVLDVVSHNIDLFEPMFVYNEQQITSTLVLEKISFPEIAEENELARQYLTRYIEESERKTLDELLLFCTGCRMLPWQKISVYFKMGDGVVVSTCSYRLTLPLVFRNYSDFKIKLDSVLGISSSANCKGKSFTSV